jgi:tetraacyldisaccharide 4'-kinase
MLGFLGTLYGKIADLRNLLYERGTFKSYSLDAKTISVGNITTGGTGKTPLVVHIAEALANRGEKVCILTRGYGRKNPRRRVLVSNSKEILSDAVEAGDEPLELAKRLIGKAIVVADPDRVAAGIWAKKEFGTTVFVLDDGFQHHKVKRDLDIVCIDGSNPFGNEKMLPVGRLREPLANLRRADVMVITRANLAKNISKIDDRIRSITRDMPIFHCRTRLDQTISLKEFQNNNDSSSISAPEKVFAFCGLGNPADFLNTLHERFEVLGNLAFRDHHFYSKKDIETIEQQARAAGANTLVTTGKDAVKLTDSDFTIPCFVASVGLTLDDEEGFRSLL